MTLRRSRRVTKETNMAKAKKKTDSKKPYVICTDKRGVFLGWLSETPLGPDVVIEPTGVRQCIYWHAATHGVLGLASDGPAAGSRIGPKVASLKLVGIHCYIPVSDAALAKWEAAPWA